MDRPEISAIQELIPPGKCETTHFHRIERPFVFVCDGEATIVTDQKRIKLPKHDRVEIPPCVPH
jgi:uncharacterized cupin superfamily protein